MLHRKNCTLPSELTHSKKGQMENHHFMAFESGTRFPFQTKKTLSYDSTFFPTQHYPKQRRIYKWILLRYTDDKTLKEGFSMKEFSSGMTNGCV